jgi:hypothetical protein
LGTKNIRNVHTAEIGVDYMLLFTEWYAGAVVIFWEGHLGNGSKLRYWEARRCA